jgi:hypothetical protein
VAPRAITAAPDVSRLLALAAQPAALLLPPPSRRTALAGLLLVRLVRALRLAAAVVRLGGVGLPRTIVGLDARRALGLAHKRRLMRLIFKSRASGLGLL